MSDTSALITRLEVIAKRYALNEVKEAAARIAELEAALKPFAEMLLSTEPLMSDCVFRGTAGDLYKMADEIRKKDANIRAARAAYLGEKDEAVSAPEGAAG